MQKIDQNEHHRTSVTITPKCKRRIKAALLILKRNGVIWSESDLLRQLAMLYLQSWRGNKLKSATARRYNNTIKGWRYVRVSWYIDKVLYSILWERGVHSGMSVSRMLEFALQYYMPRLMEVILRNPIRGNAASQRNAPYWQKRYEQRARPKPKIVVIYAAKTQMNSIIRLKSRQYYRILPFGYLLEGKIPPGWAILF